MVFAYPHYYIPTPEAQQAAGVLMSHIRDYMALHPESELHRRGKMFGVLLCSPSDADKMVESPVILWAFSGELDGSYYHDRFVEPIYAIDKRHIIGSSPEDSRLKQQWLWSQFDLLNAEGAHQTIADLWSEPYAPPSGTGECCAPKLLQAAYRRGLKPLSMAEFWMGQSPKEELRIEGQYYPACLVKCRPLLRWMLQGISVEVNPLILRGRVLASKTVILYEDEDLLIVSKPSGLLSVPGRDEQYSLEQYLIDTRSYAYLRATHRLDMDTSGILILAKNVETYTDIQRLFAEHRVQKTYRAWVQSYGESVPSCQMDDREGVISLPLLPNPLDRPRQMVDWQHGKRAVTQWRVIEHPLSERPNPSAVLIELTPETGRTHQLRVHCAHADGLNAPIIGDRLYGSLEPDNLKSEIIEARLLLHACRICLTHPRTGTPLDIVDLPDLFR